MRTFSLTAILLSLGVAAVALIAINALAAPYSFVAISEFDLWYQVLGYGKYLAFALLLWVGARDVLHHRHMGWKRAMLLWAPLLFFVAYAYVQWVILADARLAYLQATGHYTGEFSGALVYMMIVFPFALLLTALNAAWVLRRQRRMIP